MLYTQHVLILLQNML